MSEEQTPYGVKITQTENTGSEPTKADTKDSFELILLAQIDRPEESIRLSIDPEYVKELANSISQQGLLQPIVVHKTGARYRIIAGDRRYLAVSTLGWVTVPCFVKHVNPEQVDFQRAIENLVRVDMSPIEEGMAYVKLRDKYGLTVEQIAAKSGKTAVVVKRRIDLLKMPKRMQDAIHERKLTYGAAEILERIKDGSVLEYYLTFAIENGVTCDVAKQWVKDWEDTKRQSVDDTVRIESLPPVYANKITYWSCDTCQEAVDISKVKTLRICESCFNTIASNM